MPVFFAVIGTPLYDFAAGCVLAANVFYRSFQMNCEGLKYT